MRMRCAIAPQAAPQQVGNHGGAWTMGSGGGGGALTAWDSGDSSTHLSVDLTVTSSGINGGRFPTAKAARTNAMLYFRQNGSAPRSAPATRSSSSDGGNNGLSAAATSIASSSSAATLLARQQRGAASATRASSSSRYHQPLGARGQPRSRPDSAPSSPPKMEPSSQQ